MDWSKVKSLNVQLSLEYANDQMTIETLPNYDPFDFTEEAKIKFSADDIFSKYFDIVGIDWDFTKTFFDGFVIQKSLGREQNSYTIVAPSVLLSRNECTISIEDETPLGNVIDAIAHGFTLVVDDDIEDETYQNADTVGCAIMDILEDMASVFERKVYVRGKTIYITKELPKEEYGTVILDPKYTKVDITQSIGGADAYTLVIARADIDGDTVEKQERIIEADHDLVDVIIPEDDDNVDSEDKLESFLKKRVKEIKQSIFAKRFETLFNPNILPNGKVSYNGEEYNVLEVEHRISSKEWTTVVKACQC